MEALWRFGDGQTVSVALLVVLVFLTGIARRGVHWYLTKWLGVSERKASRIAAAALTAAWALTLILLSLSRGIF